MYYDKQEYINMRVVLYIVSAEKNIYLKTVSK